MPRKPKKLIRLATMNGVKLPNLAIILLTAGDKPRNMIVNGSNIIEDVKAFPPKPMGGGAITNTFTV